MRKQAYLYVFLLLAILLAGLRCGGGEKESRPEDALVCVNDECLTQRDLEYRISDELEDPLRLRKKEESVKMWIRDEILYQEAKREGFDRDRRIESLIKEKVKEFVISEFMRQEVEDKIQVTQEEAAEHYQRNRDMYVWEDDHVRLSHIFAQSMAQATLADLLLKEGNRFENVVSRTSEDASTKAKGGDLGLVRVKDLSPEIREFAARATIGEISSPIATPYGYEIVKVTDRRRKGASMGFEWAKDEIINTLTVQRRQKEADAFFRRAASKAKIEKFGWATGISLDEMR